MCGRRPTGSASPRNSSMHRADWISGPRSTKRRIYPTSSTSRQILQRRSPARWKQTLLPRTARASRGSRRRTRSVHALSQGPLFLEPTRGAANDGDRLFQSSHCRRSQYAQAYAGIANTFAPLGIHGHMHPDSARRRLRQRRCARSHSIAISRKGIRPSQHTIISTN